MSTEGQSDSTKPRCKNCNSILEGEFCHVCGQSSKVIRRPARELLHDTFSHLIQWDSRLISTFKYLFLRPGRLTKDWIEGKRMRYVPPLRLYLTASFILFLIISFTSDRTDSATPEITSDSQSIESLEAELQNAEENGEWLNAIALESAINFLNDPRAYYHKILSNLPIAAFFCLPVFALFHLICFHKKVFFIDSLMFSFHMHAFAFFILAFFTLANQVFAIHTLIMTFLYLAFPIYFLAALKSMHKQSWKRIIFKGSLMSLAYGTFLVIGVIFYLALMLVT